MAQISYGSITIIDTNDIESIIIEYARNQSTTTAPSDGWDTTRPTWQQNYYIWQRTRIHKSGTNSSADTFGAAVCLTGSTGQTGAAGRSLTSTVTKFTHVASGTTQAQVEVLAENNWGANVPTYNSSLPDYWVRITNTYDAAPLNENIYYKDNGLTDAIAKSVEANTNASNALDKANNSIISTTQLWYQTNSTTAPSVPSGHSQVDSQTYTYNNWRSTKPTNIISSYKYYYYCYEYLHGNNTYTYSTQAILDTSNLSNYEIGALQAKVKNYWWDSAGAHIASGIGGNDVIETDVSTYGYNTLTSLTGISFKYNNVKVVDLNSITPSLDFYQPPTISNNTVTQGKKTMMLSNDALTFYGLNSVGTDVEVKAILNQSGLVLSEGGLEAGTKNTTDYIYLYSKDEAINHTININNSGNKSDWRIIAGNKFGVDKAGNLYASNATISGDITAASLNINGNNYLNDITTISSKASNSAEYEVVIKVNSIDYTNSSATLIAIPTRLGESTTGSFVWYKNAINTAHGGTVSTTTNTNDTLTVSDLEALYIAVLQ